MAEDRPIGAGQDGENARADGPRLGVPVSRVWLARRRSSGLELTEEQWDEVWRLTGSDGIAFVRFGRNDSV